MRLRTTDLVTRVGKGQHRPFGAGHCSEHEVYARARVAGVRDGPPCHESVFIESKAAGTNRGAIRFVSRNGVLELYIVNAAGTIPDKEDKCEQN
jgi:hypothetical protein